MSDVKSVSTKGRNEISILFDVLGKKAKHNPPVLSNAKISYDALFLFLLPFFSIQFSLSCLPNHCKWFPSFLFKWHLQMRGTSGRQWIWNWKRHWTEDNATGTIISNPNDLKCHMMWKCCPAGFYAPYQCSIWFSDPPFTLMRWELTLFCSPANVFDVNPSKRSKLE